MRCGSLIWTSDERSKLAEPLYLLSNAVFFSAFLPLLATARVSWTALPTAPAGEPWRPLLYYSWHGYSWMSFLVLRALPSELRPTVVAHDGPRSRLNARCGAWLGLDTLVYRRRFAVPPRRQIAERARRDRRHLLLFPDSGGPYRRLKPGMLDIARQLDARLVPFVIRARPALSVGRRMRHLVASPFCRLQLVHATALEGATATVESCEQALQALEKSAAPWPPKTQFLF